MKKLPLLLIPLAIVAMFIVIRYRQSGPHLPPGVILVSGNIEATEVDVSFRIPGWVASRPVDEGQSVTKDAVVATLDSTELSESVTAAQAAVAAAKAALAEFEAGSRPEEIAAARATVARAAAEAENARKEFERQGALFQRGAVSSQILDAARTAWEVASARAKEAEESLKLVEAGPRSEEIDQARARLAQVQSQLQAAVTRLGYATVAAPISGIVLSKNIEPGEYVVAGTPVVTVGDLENVWLRAYLNEPDLARVKVGQTAVLKTDTWPDKEYQGRVSFIASEAEFTPKSVQTVEERVKLVYRVKIDVANPSMDLKPGMPADAYIHTHDGT